MALLGNSLAAPLKHPPQILVMTFSIKSFTITCLLSLLCCGLIQAQEEAAKILTGPADWRYEHIEFPLDFAPELAYKGFEELRFSPGMFDTSTTDYFTYAFVLSLQEQAPLTGQCPRNFSGEGG